MYDVIVIGAGPAGLAAAIYAQRACLKTLVFEAFAAGGQILQTYDVDNYPGLPGLTGPQLAEKFREHAQQMGAELITEKVTALQPARQEGNLTYEVHTRKEVYQTKTVLLAMGNQHGSLGVPGEAELAGMGVSYCATCDGAFYRGSDVVVVGGGDVAVEDAIFLARGCKKVYLVHRRDQLRAAQLLQDKLKSCENVEIIWNSQVSEILGQEEGEVQGVLLTNVETKEETKLEVEGVFIAVGAKPDASLYEGLVQTDERGYILAGEDGATSAPGIFAAGDVRGKALRQIITAAADGANAITSIERYLN